MDISQMPALTRLLEDKVENQEMLEKINEDLE
jgi:hypothetical protein